MYKVENMSQGKLKVHTENILPIIKKWLYTEKGIFLRELISNACDAITKAKHLASAGEIAFREEEGRIDVAIDAKGKTLTIADTGIGMTAEEVEKYIAQVAFSGAEEFAATYSQSQGKDPIIGHFGLGFFSAYMVAKKVTIDTFSRRVRSKGAYWECDGTVDYELTSSDRKEGGTAITLHIDEESEEFLQEDTIKRLLTHFCAYLPYPIYLSGKRINDKEPLWQSPPSKLEEKDYIALYRDLYPFDPDPIFWIHLNVDYPFHLQGILYFPKITSRIDWNKGQIKLFSNRVFVSDQCKEILPDFLTMLRGAIDSPDIPLNVSRSTLQVDATVRKLSTHILKKVADRLVNLHASDLKKYTEIWPDIELIVKLGALQESPFYEKIKPALIFKTLSGTHLTVEDYISLNKEKTNNKIYYTQDEHLSSHLLEIYKSRSVDILIANSPVDSALMNHLEQKIAPAAFCRLDGQLDSALLDPAKENTLLDAEGRTEGSRLTSFAKEALDHPSIEIEAKSLASEALSAILILDEEMRRLRDHMALTGQTLPHNLSSKKTLVLNTNSKLVRKILKLKTSKPELAKELTRQLYDLALLAQKEFDPKDLTPFIARTTRLLEELS